LDPRLIQTQPEPRHTIALDGRNYSYEEMEAAAVLMNIGNYYRNQAMVSDPIEPRPRYGSV
jgi:hypothetical protein